jgi:hypothetical protein
MGIAVGYAAYAMTTPASSLGRLVMLAVLVAIGVVLYSAALHVSGVAKFKDIVAAIRERGI